MSVGNKHDDNRSVSEPDETQRGVATGIVAVQLVGGDPKSLPLKPPEGQTLPVIVAEDPLTCVVRGSGMALDRMDKLGSIFSAE